MRLLRWENGDHLSLTADLYADAIPPYAILSHTWGKDADEISFADFQLGRDQYESKAGYGKLEFCGQQAKKDGIKYFWVDTCCIDKSSSAELTEAIISMYKWYHNAQKCYVYLADVPFVENVSCVKGTRYGWKAAFRVSRWFTRGWTLQELLAPKIVEFFSSCGRLLGTKSSLAEEISDITGISLAALFATSHTHFPVAERWRWAARRQTKKVEDGAYCLLGIFEIFMPLIYGEGENAFQRLEEAVRRRFDSPASIHPIRVDRTVTERKFSKRRMSEDRGSTQQVRSQILLESLRFDRIDSRFNTIEEHSPSPLQWILKTPHFRSWIDPDQIDRHGGVFWIKGKPGSGKSTIMKSLVTWAEENWRDEVVIRHFFDATSADPLETSVFGFYRSLLYQLLIAFPENKPLFLQTFSSKQRQGDLLEEWEKAELQDFSAKILREQCNQRITLFIDGLDELDGDHDSDGQNLISYLELLAEQLIPSNSALRVCIASRHYPQITTRKDVSIVLEQQAAHENAINDYIHDQLSRIGDSNMNQIRPLLVAKAQGIFLWVELVITKVSKLVDQGQALPYITKSLDIMPPDLHSMFNNIYTRELADIDECITLLQWVLFALRPLHPGELYTAVQYEAAESDLMATVSDSARLMEYLIRCSRGFVEVTPDASLVVFIHQNVRDFLLAKGTGIANTHERTDMMVDFQADHCHLKIAENCIQYLIKIRQNTITTDHEEPYLARYAATYWWQHINASGRTGSTRLAILAYTLMHNVDYLSTWVRYYDVDSMHRPDHLDMTHGRVAEDDGANNLGPPLYYAASVGLKSTAELLLDRGVDVNARGGLYGNALQVASCQGHIDTVQLLLDRDAEVNARGGAYGTALYAASAMGHTRVVQLLLDMGAEVNAQGVCTYGNALHVAARWGHAETVQALLEAGAYLEHSTSPYGTALVTASHCDHAEVVQLLLDNGANVNARGSKYGTPMIASSSRGRTRIVEILLKHSARE